ncbi:MAG: ABC transporter ATP-binding protein [Candidatus Obscuribacterales bacterium]|nr:ABC transporter ATP-binding protein [Candidatus Obscuribacterales bacterium]
MNLTAKDLAVGFDKPVAENIQLNVLGGTILAIAGPNGAGKSTLLKSLARLIKPVSGEVKISGKDIWSMSAREFAGHVSYVPQSQQFEQDLTVQELVALGRNPHQQWWSWSASSEDKDAVNEALEKTATAELRTKYLSNLSGGERQRALIATALAQRSQFMLLDEPISHLDFRHQLELAELLDSLRKQGLGIIVVLHDLNVIAKLADSVLLLEKSGQQPSRVAASASAHEVLQPALLKQVFQVDVRRIADADTSSDVYVTSL